jgi:formylglycine-generating enzyme required for sulfatase activity
MVNQNMEQIEFDTPKVNQKGQIIAYEHYSARQITQMLGQDVSLEMLIIPAGMFQMGSLRHTGNDDERPQHLVTVKSFLMGRYPITQEQWKVVMGSLPPCRFKGDKRPIEQVSWESARKFCQRLSKITGRDYRLPSEAQWEYACRAETSTAFSFGEAISTDLANYCGEHIYREGPKGLYRHETTLVDTFPPNAFGLCDMHGNLWEWCADAWHDDYQAAPRDGSTWEGGTSRNRVARGGSWHEPPDNCRSATRIQFNPIEADDFIGFRVAADIS